MLVSGVFCVRCSRMYINFLAGLEVLEKIGIGGLFSIYVTVFLKKSYVT